MMKKQPWCLFDWLNKSPGQAKGQGIQGWQAHSA